MNLKNKVGYHLQGKHTDVIKLWERKICLINLKIRYREFETKKEAIYNYRNFYKLMSVAPKLLYCRVNMTYFVKNHEIRFSSF